MPFDSGDAPDFDSGADPGVDPDVNDASAMQFVAALGAAMAAANYPVTIVHETMVTASQKYGLDNQYLALPNYVQVGTARGGGRLFIAHPDQDLRFDQTFPLATLIERVYSGAVTPAEGRAELDRIWRMPNRFPAWVGVIGYTLQSAGLSLILQPAPLTLVMAVVLGAMVGVICELARHNDPLQQLLPIICAFAVSLVAFLATDWLHLADASLRALAPPLATFLPGAAITLAVAELSSRQLLSGASRLVSGLMRMAQLAFGILVAVQVAGISESHLSVAHVDRLGPWAPWLGILLYGLGAMLSLGPPTRFLPWMFAMLTVAYLGQLAGNAVLGSYGAGFGGGFALVVCALAVARRPDAPAAMSLILPGFWLLVPGSLGLMGVTELLGTDTTTVFTATFVSMISIALGVQSGILVWRAGRNGRTSS